MNVCDNNMCTGCMACLDICSKKAITIIDNIDSYKAEINKDLCVNCGACNKGCQQNQIINVKAPIFWQQGWSKEENVRKDSSSGGVGYELIKKFIEKHGLVCTCKFDKGEFVYDFVQGIDDIKNYIGSKYVKSSPKGIYEKVKECLICGKKVLFIGIPCHVVALKLFCGEELLHDLYTVDLICHGTPSPQLLEKFLAEYNISLKNVENIKFREKSNFHLYVQSTEKYLPERVMDMYTYAFLNGLDYTDNCYECKYARIERASDITIGDCWGTNLHNESKNGISIILCQTEKGLNLLNELELYLEKVDLKKECEENHQLKHPMEMHPQREYFMKGIKHGRSFKRLAAHCFPKTYIKQAIKMILIKLGLM